MPSASIHVHKFGGTSLADAARIRALGALLDDRPGPRAVVARTRKGCGVSFMEDRMEWHYLPMTEPQYHQAVLDIERSCETSSAGPS